MEALEMRHGHKTSLQIIAWLPALFIWMCVIAHLKHFYGTGAAGLGIVLMLGGLFVYDLMRNGEKS